MKGLTQLTGLEANKKWEESFVSHRILKVEEMLDESIKIVVNVIDGLSKCDSRGSVP